MKNLDFVFDKLDDTMDSISDALEAHEPYKHSTYEQAGSVANALSTFDVSWKLYKLG